MEIMKWMLLLFSLTVDPKQVQTERAFSGEYLYRSDVGTYCCAVCNSPLFRSEDKYDSGSGWPSFTAVIHSKNVYYLEDPGAPVKRYKVLCRTCEGHLGHVFHDGPPPKFLRYCIHSICLIFKEKPGILE